MAEAYSGSNQYLTFKLDEEFFTVNVSSIREALEHLKITKMPDAPPFMRGIIEVIEEIAGKKDLLALNAAAASGVRKLA
ncbi:MAG: chemotaxis protein CheW [Desulfobacteraceae bacterium]|nr:chemotaxis protein CheW [Desulfobacteraceae bacterium]